MLNANHFFSFPFYIFAEENPSACTLYCAVLALNDHEPGLVEMIWAFVQAMQDADDEAIDAWNDAFSYVYELKLYANDLQTSDDLLRFELRFLLYGGGPAGGVAVKWLQNHADGCRFFKWHSTFGTEITYTPIADGSLFYESDASYNRLYVGDAADLPAHPDPEWHHPVEFTFEDFLLLWDEDGEKQETLLQEKLEECVEREAADGSSSDEAASGK